MRVKPILLLAMLILATFLAPHAQAAPATCTTVQTDQGIFYVCSDGTVWEETNGLAGLQRVRTIMGGGRVFEPDARIVA